MNIGRFTPSEIVVTLFLSGKWWGCLVVCLLMGCGTAKMSNTSRTATEQLLLSDAMDRAVSQADFSAVAGKDIFIDSVAIESFTDHKYLVSLVRQHAFASGCRIKEKKEDAEYIVELRAGAIGTDQHDTLIGVTEMTIPAFPGFDSTAVPEIAIAKRTIQKAVVKIGIFAYTAESRRPVWQSGNLIAESRARNRWLFGMGPYQTGEIFTKTTIDGVQIDIPLVNLEEKHNSVPLGDQVFFSVSEESSPEEKKEEQVTEKKPEEEKKVDQVAEKKPEKAPSDKTLPPVPALEKGETAPAIGKQATLPPPAPYNALSPPPLAESKG
ncbi:MAG: hypothetical protein Q4D62_14245 [Planctomycetia bacterium]|nr:hypothetical protein [Planctomycetia bacterium]